MKGKNWLVRAGSALLAVGLLLGGLPSVLASAEPTVWLTGKFDSPAYPGRELSYPFPYRDGYFTIPATDYQHSLAQCTLGLAVSAFRAADLELDRKDEYIRDYLGSAGFGNMESHQFDEKPTADTIASLLASKTLRDGEGEFLLVAVAISGGGYEDEWLSNFSFGDESVHNGFFNAAFTVFQRIFDYVDISQTIPTLLHLCSFLPSVYQFFTPCAREREVYQPLFEAAYILRYMQRGQNAATEKRMLACITCSNCVGHQIL